MQLEKQRVQFLEAARGIAAAVVVLYHFNMFFPQLFLSGTDPDNVILVNGIFGVSFFFVLSGYALGHGKLQVTAARPWLGAALKRYPQLILPVLASTVLAACLARLPLSPLPEIVERYGPSITRALFEAANDPYHSLHQSLVTPLALGNNHPLNPVIWSLRIEIIGSLGVFALYWVAANIGRRRWILFALLLPRSMRRRAPTGWPFFLGSCCMKKLWAPTGFQRSCGRGCWRRLPSWR